MNKQKKLTARELALLRQYGWGGALEGMATGAVSGAVAGTAVEPGWGTLAGAVVGGVVGAVGGDAQEDSEDAYNAKKERAIRKRQAEADMWGNPGVATQGNWHAPQYAAGGGLPNSAPQSYMANYSGQTHQGPQQGIPVDPMGRPSAVSGREPIALVEDNEVQWNGYVFSDRLKGQDGKTFATKAKKVIGKYKKRLGDDLEHDDQMATEAMNNELDSLANENEMARIAKDEGKSFGKGQRLTPADYSQQPASLKKYGSGGVAGWEGVDVENYQGKGGSYSGGGGFNMGTAMGAVGAAGEMVDLGMSYSNAVSGINSQTMQLQRDMEQHDRAMQEKLARQGIGYHPSKMYKDGGLIEGAGIETFSPEEEGEMLGIGPPPELNDTMALFGEMEDMLADGGGLDMAYNNQQAYARSRAYNAALSDNKPRIWQAGNPDLSQFKPVTQNPGFWTQASEDALMNRSYQNKIIDEVNPAANAQQEQQQTLPASTPQIPTIGRTANIPTMESLRSPEAEATLDRASQNMIPFQEAQAADFTGYGEDNWQPVPFEYKRDWLAYGPALANIGRGIFGKAEYMNPNDYTVTPNIKAKEYRTDEARKSAERAHYNRLRAYNPNSPTANAAQRIASSTAMSEDISGIEERAYNINSAERARVSQLKKQIEQSNASMALNIEDRNAQARAAKENMITTGVGQLANTISMQKQDETQQRMIDAMYPTYENLAAKQDGTADTFGNESYTDPKTGKTVTNDNPKAPTAGLTVKEYKKKYPWARGMSDEGIQAAIDLGSDPLETQPVEGLTNRQDRKRSRYIKKHNLTEEEAANIPQRVIDAESDDDVDLFADDGSEKVTRRIGGASSEAYIDAQGRFQDPGATRESASVNQQPQSPDENYGPGRIIPDSEAKQWKKDNPEYKDKSNDWVKAVIAGNVDPATVHSGGGIGEPTGNTTDADIKQWRKDNPKFADYNDDEVAAMIQGKQNMDDVTYGGGAGADPNARRRENRMEAKANPSSPDPVEEWRKNNPNYADYDDDEVIAMIAGKVDMSTVNPAGGVGDPTPLDKPNTSTELSATDLKIMQEEGGFEPNIYKDSARKEDDPDFKGYDTIGYGHKLTKEEIASGKYKDGITEPEALALYKEDKARTSRGFYEKAPWAKSSPPIVREILEDMAFNVGAEGLLGFKNTLKYIKAGDYKKAAEHIKQSKYYTQVPNRAKRNIQKLLSLANG